MTSRRTPPTKPIANPSNQRRYWSYWLGLALVAWVLHYFSAILQPFALAAVVAYVCHPAFAKLRARAVPASAAALLVLSLVLFIFFALALLILPMLVHQTADLAKRLPDVTDWFKASVIPHLQMWLGGGVNIDTEFVAGWLRDHMEDLKTIALAALPSLGAGTSALISLFANLALLPLLVFYFLRDGDVLLNRLTALVPRPALPTTERFLQELNTVLSEFLRGQLSVMAIMSVYYSTTLSIIGLPYAASIGCIAGLLVFVPYVGMLIGLVLATLTGLLYFDGVSGLLLVWGAFLFGQMLEGMVVTPHFVGRRVGLHPVSVLFALMFFGQLFGFLGLLLALPLASAALVAWRVAEPTYRSSAWYRGDDSAS